MAINEKALGADIATMLENYAGVLRGLNRDPEAEDMEERAAAIRKAGADKPSP